MPLTKDQIKEAALQLNPGDRETLAEDLLLSITEQERSAMDAAWLAEVHRRDASPLMVGKNARTMESVLDGLNDRLKR
jgi:hypothetical protein